jgi:hypothetical protein
MSQPVTKAIDHRIGYFVSPHGFGHAARAAGVMAAIHEMDDSFHFDIFSSVPRWFFQDSLAGGFSYHRLQTDIGIVQKDPLNEDLSETVRYLNEFFPLDHSRISDQVDLIRTMKIELIICDIAPMGIAVAREAGIPSVLVENFTWDWIYEGYLDQEPRLEKHVLYLRGLFSETDYHVQTEPVCRYGKKADLKTLPISRKVRTPASAIRRQLGVPKDNKMMTITMGGIPDHYPFLDQLASHRGVHFVVPGASRSTETHGNLILLPHHSDFFHPDLINASDAVVGKVGYSTLAEVYYAGIPFGYVPRAAFRESPVIGRFIEKNMAGMGIEPDEFQDGSWVYRVQRLLALPRVSRSGSNGAEAVAQFICSLMT